MDTIEALNELVRELTKHADALRDALESAIGWCETENLPNAVSQREWQARIDDYDNFIKEA